MFLAIMYNTQSNTYTIKVKARRGEHLIHKTEEQTHDHYSHLVIWWPLVVQALNAPGVWIKAPGYEG